MLKTLLFLSLLLYPACGNIVAPVDPLNGTWCPVDSLTEYQFEVPKGHPVVRYVPERGAGGYSLTLQDGTVTPAGSYNGWFDTGRATLDTGHFYLPSSPGTYFVGHNIFVKFTFPYPAAGPTWFWEYAHHINDGTMMESFLDDSTNLPGNRVLIRFVWTRCFPT